MSVKRLLGLEKRNPVESQSMVLEGMKYHNIYEQSLANSKAQVYEAGRYWEYPTIPFRTDFNYYLKDPGVFSAVNTRQMEIMGNGFHITSDVPDVVEIIDTWNNKQDFEEKLMLQTKDKLITGNAITEVLSDGNRFDLNSVDMRTIIAMQRDEYGKIEYYVNQTQKLGQGQIEPEGLIHTKLSEVGRQAWGISAFESNAVPFFEFEGQQWSMIDAMGQMRSDFIRIIHKYASPKDVYVFENEDEEVLRDEFMKHKKLKFGESRFTNKMFEHKELTINGTARFRDYIDFLSNSNENGLQAPTSKIMTAAGISNATYASAEAAREMFEKIIEADRRKIKKEVEIHIYTPLLKLYDFDLKETNTQFNWGLQENPKLELSDIFTAINTKVITTKEARKMLSELGWQIDSEEIPAEPNPEQGNGFATVRKVGAQLTK